MNFCSFGAIFEINLEDSLHSLKKNIQASLILFCSFGAIFVVN